LKQQRDKIKQYQKRINHQLEREKDVVRKLVQDNKKERALLLLKKKRFMESMLEKSDNHLMKIEEMVQTIEYQEMQIDIVERLAEGNEALKKLNDALDIERIEDILSETKEGADKQKEISRLFSGQAGDEIADDDDLLKELNELVGEDEKMPDADKLPNVVNELPDVSKLQPVEISTEVVEENQEERSAKKAKVMVEAS